MSDLPSGWVEATLDQVVYPDRPRELPADHPDLPFVGMEHVEAHTMRLLDTIPASQLKSSAVHFQPGDVLYGRLRPYLNKVLLASFEGLCSAEFIVFGSRAEINSAWLAYRLNSSDFVSFASHLNAGDRPRVDFDQIGQYRLLVSPRDEQDRIVAEIEKQFTRLDAAMTALKRVQANLKRYRASVLKSACEGRLVPTEAELARKEGRDYEPASKLLERILRERRLRWEDDTLAQMINGGKPPLDGRWKQKYKEPFAAHDTIDLPDLPVGWCWGTLDSLIFGITAGKSFRCEERPPTDGEYGVVKVSAVTWGEFDELESKTCMAGSPWIGAYQIRTDDFLFSRANTIELVGACVIVKHVSRELMLSDKILRLDAVLPILKFWLLIVLRSKWGRTEIERLSTGNQESMRNIGQDRIRSIRMPIAPFKEMERIVATAEASESRFTKLRDSAAAQIRRSQRMHQAILERAFSGQLVPQDPNDEPASALLDRIRHEQALSRKTKNGEKRSAQRSQTQMRPKSEPTTKAIIAALAEAESPLSPEELFRSSGHDPATIDEFFAELKAGVDAGEIEEIRAGDDGILLRVRRP